MILPWIAFLFNCLLVFKLILNTYMEKAMATHSSTLAWKIPWTEDEAALTLAFQLLLVLPPNGGAYTWVFILLDLHCMYYRKHLLSLNCKLATAGMIILFIFCTSSNLTKWRAQIYLMDVGSVVMYLEEPKEDSVFQFHSASWFVFPIT